MIISKILTSLAVILLIGACTQKTQSTVQSTANKTESRSADRSKRGGPPSFSKMLEKMDSNQDGQISASEVQGRLKDNFTTIDADGDGYITETEMQNAPRPERRKKHQ